VTDDIGFRESAPAILTVLESPMITLQPTPAYQEVLQSSTFTIAVAATGTQPLSYKWRRSNITIVNQTNAVLRITNAVGGHAGSYSVIVTNIANAVTSAVAVVVYQADNDRDGLADYWERLFGFDTNSMSDAALDLDGDGISNRAEYIAGTDPSRSAELSEDRQHLCRWSSNDDSILRGFEPDLHRALQKHRWTRARGPDWPTCRPGASNRVEVVVDSAPMTQRFYRLVR
jgi:hypothetical protein